MRFPVTIRHRSSKAKVYAPGKGFAYYQHCYTAAGRRRIQTFPDYPEARQAGEKIARELAEDSVVSILETTAADGKSYATRYYNLDAAISSLCAFGGPKLVRLPAYACALESGQHFRGNVDKYESLSTDSRKRVVETAIGQIGRLRQKTANLWLHELPHHRASARSRTFS